MNAQSLVQEICWTLGICQTIAIAFLAMISNNRGVGRDPLAIMLFLSALTAPTGLILAGLGALTWTIAGALGAIAVGLTVVPLIARNLILTHHDRQNADASRKTDL